MAEAESAASADSSGGAQGSVDPEEIAKFAALAEDWWDPEGRFRPLHKLNPVRLTFVRDRVAAHFG
ncbi:MAG TPA: bifunctional 3-demethylubiquinol 3-O-methyltransferase/2-polyprenyl-6-hydroxyphenol methylase, partial [Kiloniellales bacterium]|nr:bifunctional 3-demethylubiquinol 3-O-methyltransferase/2-polyprenyl-6-hydroxyphenol methylase [Kiloniellales bacterium]